MSCWFIPVILGDVPGQPKPPAGSEAREFFVSYEGPAVGIWEVGGRLGKTHTCFSARKGLSLFFLSEGDSSLGLLGGDLPFFFPK